MRLHIENIAKIEKADIEIDGITVIAGSNNTGKSTVGKALFAMFDAFYNLEEFVQEWKPNDAKKILRKHGGNLDLICKKLSGAKRRKLSLSEELQESYAYKIASCKGEAKIIECMEEYCFKHLQLYSIEEQIHSDEVRFWFSFACGDIIDNMINYDSYYAEKVGVQRVFQGIFGGQITKRTKVNEKNANAKQAVVRIEINSKESVRYKMQNSVILERDDIKKIEQEFTVTTKALYIENPRILKQFSRLGIESNEEAVRKIIGEWLIPDEGNGYFGRGIGAYRRNDWSKEKEDSVLKDAESNVEMQCLDEIIEDVDKELVHLMNGTIEFEVKNSPLMFQDEDYSESFRLNNLSTGLKAISLLQCLLHYRVLKKKSVVILDEPEINLHPEWQVKYAQFIAFLQEKLKLHIVITTHSPFFLKAIENASYEYGIENHCHYYYAENKAGDAVLECVDEDIESVYSKMMMPLFDMIADMGL